MIDNSHLGSAGEEHLAATPTKLVADEVGTDWANALGTGNRIERQPAPAALVPLCLRPLEGRLHHAGVGDGRERVDGDAGRCNPAQLPSEGSDNTLGHAVATGVGGPPTRARRDAENAPVPGGRHEGQCRLKHVQVPRKVHVEQRKPVFLAASGGVALARDAGDVHDGVEPTPLVRQFAKDPLNGGAVGDRGREDRALPPAATMRPAVVSSFGAAGRCPRASPSDPM